MKGLPFLKQCLISPFSTFFQNKTYKLTICNKLVLYKSFQKVGNRLIFLFGATCQQEVGPSNTGVMMMRWMHGRRASKAWLITDSAFLPNIWSGERTRFGNRSIHQTARESEADCGTDISVSQ